MKLPSLRGSGNTRSRQESFGGYNHTVGAINGEIFDMKNLTSDDFPVLSSRKKRHTVQSVTAPHGIFVADAVYIADGTHLYRNGTSIGNVTNTDKIFCGLGDRVIVFPDKKIYENGAFKSLEASYSGTGLSFQDGTYAEESAESNTIYKAGVSWGDYFSVGDAVTISGCTTHAENNKTIIIREISGAYLRFYENSFTNGTESGSVTIERKVPDLDFICTNENRVWGCKGDTIYASKLGDPFNWNVFDGIATDSYSVESGTPGDFTGCYSFLGYPVFFKEDRILKVYGSTPQNFQTSASATLGIAPGSAKSAAVAGEVMYYLSRAGIVAYAGGIPNPVSEAFGEMNYKNAVGGSDGLKYYVCMQDSSNNYHLFCYDTKKSLWHKEDNLAVKFMAYSNGVMAVTASSVILLGDPVAVPNGATTEGAFESVVEFGDFDYNTFDFKHLVRLRLRLEIDTGATVTIFAKFDEGVYVPINEIKAQAKGFYFQPVPIRRCDHYRLKLIATGGWKLHAIDYEYYTGGRK